MLAADRTTVAAVLVMLIAAMLSLPRAEADPPGFRLQVDHGHSGLIGRLAVAPDGRSLASAGSDGTARLWSMNGRLLAILHGHTGAVNDLAWHPSGALVVTAAADNMLRLWDADGTLLWARPTEAWGNVYPPRAVAMDESQIHALLAGSIITFDLNGNILAQQQVEPAGTTAEVVIDGAGNVLATSRRGVEALGSASEPPPLPEAFAGEVTRIASRPADGAILAGSDAGCIALLNGAAWSLLAPCSVDPNRWLPGPRRIVAVFFDGDTPTALSADGRMQSFPPTGQNVMDLELSAELSAAAILPGSTSLALAIGNHLIAQDTDGEGRFFAGSRAHYLTVDVAADGSHFALGSMEGQLQVWRRDGSLAWTADAHEAPLRALRWHPHLPLLATRTDSDLALWHADGRLLGRMPMQSLGAAFRWDAEADFVIWASGHVPQGWDLSNSALLATAETPEIGEPYPHVIVEGRDQLLVLGSDGTLAAGNATGSRTLRVPEAERLPASLSPLLAATTLADGGHATIDRSGQIVRWHANGSRRWHRAGFSSSSLAGHYLTADRARRWCAVGARFEADPDTAIEACVEGFDIRPPPAPGIMDISYWQQALTPPSPIGWRPERAILEAPTGDRLASGGWDGTVTIWNPAGDMLHRHQVHGTPVESLAWFPDGRHLISVAAGGGATLLDTDSGQHLELIANGDEWVVWNTKGQFSASRNGGPLLSVVAGRDAWPVDQFAPRLNDPAGLLEPLGLIGPQQAEHYRAARARRYARLDVESDLDPHAAPSARIRQVERDGDHLLLQVNLSAESAPLSHWQVWADQVPVNLDNNGALTGVTDSVELTARVPLLNGSNRIEISVTDAAGYESPRASTRITHQREESPALYFAGFGISDYRLPWLPRLFYAHQDAIDLAGAFSTLAPQFKELRTKTWLNDEVDANSLSEARAFFEQARPEDLVVLFIAGHGTYERSAEGIFYYLLPDSEQDQLATTAISFEEIEGLLYGLRSRRKLLLMDTCESGELAGERELARFESAVAAGILPRTIAPSSNAATANHDTPRPARWLRQRDRFIYADIARRSGAIVLSSSMPNETSAEAGYLGNGLFTQGLLNALTDPGLDPTGDGWVSVTELFEATYAFVTRESDLDDGDGPGQHPVIDRDNLQLDVRLPLVPESERRQFRFGD